jgi:hypothetical protein
VITPAEDLHPWAVDGVSGWTPQVVLRAYDALQACVAKSVLAYQPDDKPYDFFKVCAEAFMIGLVPVLWKSSIWHAATAGAEDTFTGTLIPEEGFSPQYWLLEAPVRVWVSDQFCAYRATSGGRYALVGVLVLPTLDAEKNRTLSFTSVYRKLGTPDGDTAHYFDFHPLVHRGAPCPATLARPLAAFHFMEQEFVTQERATFPRHVRRAAELGRRPPLPEVKTVTLRRAASEPKPPGHVPAEVDWSCQWLVAGHWRKQLCKSLTKKGDYEYRPVYVRAHVRGPEDKPLREPKGPVYVVRR